MAKKIRDAQAEMLEAAGFWRRAASRWLEVMKWCETDAQREWASQRRRYCYSRIQQPVSEKLDIHAINKAASLTQQRMGISLQGGGSIQDEISKGK